MSEPSAGEKRRVFLALMLGPERGARLLWSVEEALGPEARSAFRLPRPEGLHLTLFFLGDVEQERIERLWERVAGAVRGLAPPRLVLSSSGAFPLRGPPRVLWIGVREEPPGEGRLSRIHDGVLRGVESAGFDVREERGRAFRPHVTVARPRSDRARRTPAFDALAPAIPWRPRSLALVESIRSKGPARYVPLAEQAW